MAQAAQQAYSIGIEGLALLGEHAAEVGVLQVLPEVLNTEVIRAWAKSLRRRSQRHRLNWKRMTRLADRWLPLAKTQHPWPDERFYAKTRGGSPVR